MFKTALRGIAAYAALPAAAIAALPAIAFAEEAKADSFVYQGVEYTYTAETRDGVKYLTGTAHSGHVPFRLRVGKRTVTGTFNNRAVQFSRSDVKAVVPRVDVAMR